MPHSIYPAGYHCKPIKPLPFAGIVSQKKSNNLYRMGLYSDSSLLECFVAEYPKHITQKLDVGKSCIRFKNLDQIPYQFIGELMKKMSVKKWIIIYENNLNR